MKVTGTRPLRTRLGLHGYGRVLCRIARAPVTFEVLLQEGLCGSKTNGHALLGAFHRLQRIHIKAWHEINGRQLQAVWAYGSGDDAPAPTHRAGGKRRAPNVFIPATPILLPSHMDFEALLTELEVPRTALDLSDRTEINVATVRRALEGLKPLVREVGLDRGAALYQLREAAAGIPQRSRLGADVGRVASVFHLAQAANEARRAA